MEVIRLKVQGFYELWRGNDKTARQIFIDAAIADAKCFIDQEADKIGRNQMVPRQKYFGLYCVLSKQEKEAVQAQIVAYAKEKGLPAAIFVQEDRLGNDNGIQRLIKWGTRSYGGFDAITITTQNPTEKENTEQKAA